MFHLLPYGFWTIWRTRNPTSASMMSIPSFRRPSSTHSLKSSIHFLTETGDWAVSWFRFFFSSHVSGAGGEEVSSTAIRARIRKLIADEEPGKPLSDAQLAGILARDGVKVARRTVAKYREAIGLASSSERRHTLAQDRA